MFCKLSFTFYIPFCTKTSHTSEYSVHPGKTIYFFFLICLCFGEILIERKQESYYEHKVIKLKVRVNKTKKSDEYAYKVYSLLLRLIQSLVQCLLQDKASQLFCFTTQCFQNETFEKPHTRCEASYEVLYETLNKQKYWVLVTVCYEQPLTKYGSVRMDALFHQYGDHEQ